jgi:hypothetical protein
MICPRCRSTLRFEYKLGENFEFEVYSHPAETKCAIIQIRIELES